MISDSPLLLQLRPHILWKREMRGAVAVQVADLAAAKLEGVLATLSRTRLNAGPRCDFADDLFAGWLFVGHDRLRNIDRIKAGSGAGPQTRATNTFDSASPRKRVRHDRDPPEPRASPGETPSVHGALSTARPPSKCHGVVLYPVLPTRRWRAHSHHRRPLSRARGRLSFQLRSRGRQAGAPNSRPARLGRRCGSAPDRAIRRPRDSTRRCAARAVRCERLSVRAPAASRS